jgi:hypothetical protein
MQWSQKNKQRDPVQLGIRIQIDAVAMQKLWTWTDIAHGEVSALGLVEEIRDPNNGTVTALLITDMFLVKQQCSMDETTMDPQAVGQLMADLEANGIDSRKLRLWAHSHAGMSVFWSGTDDECINGLANGDYLVSFVTNKKRDAIVRLDCYHPTHLFVSDCVWEIKYPLVDGLAEACFAEFRSKVKEHSGLSLPRSGRNHIADLKAAHSRGSLTDEDLQEEMNWMGLTCEDFDEVP